MQLFTRAHEACPTPTDLLILGADDGILILFFMLYVLSRRGLKRKSMSELSSFLN